MFTYHLLGKDFIPYEDDAVKVYSLLGKKFYLHDINFSISNDAFKFSNEGIEGKIAQVYNYGQSKYYLVNVKGEDNEASLIVRLIR